MPAAAPRWQWHTLSPPQSRAIRFCSASGSSGRIQGAQFHPRTHQDRLVITQQLPEFIGVEKTGYRPQGICKLRAENDHLQRTTCSSVGQCTVKVDNVLWWRSISWVGVVHPGSNLHGVIGLFLFQPQPSEQKQGLSTKGPRIQDPRQLRMVLGSSETMSVKRRINIHTNVGHQHEPQSTGLLFSLRTPEPSPVLPSLPHVPSSQNQVHHAPFLSPLFSVQTSLPTA